MRTPERTVQFWSYASALSKKGYIDKGLALVKELSWGCKFSVTNSKGSG